MTSPFREPGERPDYPPDSTKKTLHKEHKTSSRKLQKVLLTVGLWSITTAILGDIWDRTQGGGLLLALIAIGSVHTIVAIGVVVAILDTEL